MALRPNPDSFDRSSSVSNQASTAPYGINGFGNRTRLFDPNELRRGDCHHVDKDKGEYFFHSLEEYLKVNFVQQRCYPALSGSIHSDAMKNLGFAVLESLADWVVEGVVYSVKVVQNETDLVFLRVGYNQKATDKLRTNNILKDYDGLLKEELINGEDLWRKELGAMEKRILETIGSIGKEEPKTEEPKVKEEPKQCANHNPMDYRDPATNPEIAYTNPQFVLLMSRHHLIRVTQKELFISL